jgi:hypothetical protein
VFLLEHVGEALGVLDGRAREAKPPPVRVAERTVEHVDEIAHDFG